MKIGSYELTALETGRFSLDGGAMFGVVPKAIWNRSNPADDKNRIEMAARTLMITDGKRRILVDTGVGAGWDEKFIEIYGVDNGRGGLVASLEAAGVSADEVTDVILTHLHFDHAGGATLRDRNGSRVPTFPNANYFVQKKHFEWAVNPSDKDRASFRTERFLPLMDHERLRLLDGEREIYPGIFIRLTDGHTIGHQTILITDGQTSLYHPGDTIPTASHVPLPFIMGYDNYPLTTLEEKKNILRRAAEEKWVLFFEHDPYHAAALAAKTEKGYKAGDTIETF